jgi:cytochrome c peroxidase
MLDRLGHEIFPRCTGPGALALATSTLGLLTLAGCGGTSAVEEWTTLDLGHLDNYASLSLPAPYRDAAVVALDNSAGAPITDAGATLGRVLFFDPRLSVNQRISCASCHLPSHGFTDSVQYSRGHDGTALPLRTMRLVNARWYAGPGFFWDRRAPSLEAQVTAPIVHRHEMGWVPSTGGLDTLFARLRNLPYYPPLFTLAWGDDDITRERVERALAMYVRSIVAVDSRWDRAYAAVYTDTLPDRGLSLDLPGFTPQENRGRALFVQSRADGGFGCASCHVPPTFALDPAALGNGITPDEPTVFKAPSLKNVAQAGHYMHDGRFPRLDLVAAFYADFVAPGPAVDPRLRNPDGSQVRLRATQAQTEAIAAFLATLTDTTLVHDSRFQDPFRKPRP